ncbi:MAG: SMC-Scp complex subunit ScpB [Oscillospiraceae bacterium]|nr:SMC-Scp complex subunit ScpB [Oscillospiraceae bacterium]
MRDLEAALEGILFAAGEPIHIDRICSSLEINRSTAEKLLGKLGDYYAFERRGIRLLHMENDWQLCTAPEYAAVIRRTFEIRKPAKLSQPALEVLAIVAYYQPVTRAYVDQVRGVDSAYTVSLLLDRDLIEVCGQLKEQPGRPRLYRTTENFLRSFHISSLEELPPLPGMDESGQLRLDSQDGEGGAAEE